jgi:hypothetical protein|tara:strand:- start:59 stop:706 length:648 start_codon:yes stop_codon:yes gene_type:complete
MAVNDINQMTRPLSVVDNDKEQMIKNFKAAKLRPDGSANIAGMTLGEARNSGFKNMRLADKTFDNKAAAKSMKQAGIANLAGGTTGDLRGLNAAFTRNAFVPMNREDLEVRTPNVDYDGYQPVEKPVKLAFNEIYPGGGGFRETSREGDAKLLMAKRNQIIEILNYRVADKSIDPYRAAEIIDSITTGETPNPELINQLYTNIVATDRIMDDKGR